MSKKEYIERNALKNDGHSCWHDGKGNVYYEIDHVPAADVVEVVHGEWKLHGNDDDLGSTYWCSHCYFQVDEELFYPHGYDEEKPYNYCPRCGAKMDGATDNNVGGKRKE